MDSSTTNVTEYRKQHLEMLAKDLSKSITGVVLVVDINDRASFAEARDSLRVLAKTCNLSKGTVPVLVLANKVDLLPSGSDIGSMLMQLENDLDLNAEGIQGLKYAGCRDIAAAKGLHVREAYMSFSDLM
jgi:signal recognition particle receptor subunit beta